MMLNSYWTKSIILGVRETILGEASAEFFLVFVSHE